MNTARTILLSLLIVTGLAAAARENSGAGGTPSNGAADPGVYPAMDTSGWLKSGRSCVKKPMLGPGCKGYVRTSSMEADASLAGKLSTNINSYMRRFGFDYTEHPNCTGGYGGHIDGLHGDADLDPDLNRYVFRFGVNSESTAVLPAAVWIAIRSDRARCSRTSPSG